MMRLVVAVLVVIAWAPGLAAAETLLRLSETGRVSVKPDQLAAVLRIEVEAPQARDAQARVNTTMKRAVERAQEAGVVAVTGGYGVWQVSRPSQGWRASASLSLHSGDGDKMLALLGVLQGEGLGLQQLGWRLAPETARQAQSEATKLALGALRARATEAAGILGLRFASFREVRLDGGRPGYAPVPRMAMAASAAPAPPPVAVAEDTVVEASVEADAVLVPN